MAEEDSPKRETPAQRERRLIEAARQQESESTGPDDKSVVPPLIDQPGPDTDSDQLSSVGEDIDIAHVNASLLEALIAPPEADLADEVQAELSRYEILESLGTGGMGEVYKARDRRLGRLVALKRIDKEIAGSPRMMKRFLVEARTAAALNHYNIVQVHDIDQDEHGHFITMEYIEGEDLKTRIDRDGKIDPERAIEITRQLCSALSYAHAHDIIHRDIKPGNVLINNQGTPKLVDFGLALMAERKAPSLTQTGAMMGTIEYASPEQLTDAKTVDLRTDIYSLGATLYEMLTGLSPRRLEETRIPEELRPCVMKALQPDREQRYRSAREFNEALGRVVIGDVDTLMRKGDVCYQGGDLEGALERYRRVLKIDASHPDARRKAELIETKIDEIHRDRQQADQAARRGDWPSAAAAWQRILNAAPGDIEAIQQHARAEAEIRNARLTAAIEKARGDLEKNDPLAAEAHCRRAFEIDPDNQEVAAIQEAVRAAKRRLRRHKTRAGAQAYNQRDYPAAVGLLNEALALMADDHPNRPKLEQARDLAQASQWLAEADQAIDAGEILQAAELLDRAEQKYGKIRNVIDRVNRRRKKIEQKQAQAARQAAIHYRRRMLMIGGGSAVGLTVLLAIAIQIFRSPSPEPSDMATQVSNGMPGVSPHAEDAGATAGRPEAVDEQTTRTTKAPPSPGAVGAYQPYELVKTLEMISGDVGNVDFSPDGKHLVCSHQGRLSLYDLGRGVVLKTVDAVSGCVHGVSFSPDGKRIVSAGHNGKIRIWDADLNELLKTIEGLSGPLACVALDPPGRRIATGGRQNRVRIWDTATGECLRALEGHSAGITAVAFSPGGRLVISGSNDKTVRIWDVLSGQCLHKLNGLHFVKSIALSSDGRLVVAGLLNNWLMVWDIATGYLVKSFSAHEECTHAVAFSPDGKLIIAGSRSGNLQIWNAETFESLQTIKAYTNWVTSLAFSPDGRRLASGARSEPAKIWAQQAADQLVAGVRPPVERLYVNAEARGSSNGTSWANAYESLQDALASAKPGQEIWVAAGVYKPAGLGGDRTATFQLRNGVAIYGGFAGGESRRDQRDPAKNETILSGDLNGNDGPDGPDFFNSGDNSYHVVTGSSADRTAILEGFTITGGNANQMKPYSRCGGGGMVANHGSPMVTDCTFRGNMAIFGGGIWMWKGGNPTIINCVFKGNYATKNSGGIDIWDSSPTIINCSFVENATGPTNGEDTGQGGGVWSVGNNCRPTLTNCKFSRNTSQDGGGMGNGYGSTPTLINCIFSGNSASSHGGGLFNKMNSRPKLINCTFSGNVAGSQGGGIWNSASTSTLTNCVLWGNSDSSGTGESAQIAGDGKRVVNYSCVQGWTGVWGGTGNIGKTPLLIDANGPDNIAGTQDDDLRLEAASPCIDAGDKTALSADVSDLDGDGDTGEPIPLDLDGNPRIAGPTVDLGAYEFRSIASPASAVSTERRRKRILFYSQSAGYQHEVVTRPSSRELSFAEKLFEEFATNAGYRVDCSQDPNDLKNNDQFNSFDAIVLYTTGDPEINRAGFLLAQKRRCIVEY